ncbi:response regulator [Paenibacillus polymyxa]|uniref:response regulator n=1 Tax=Paenibacillus polymyxa TaxID=1406 RepID=UPI0004D4460A|nr:response regulator [Paenibacillus polymyxa]KEO76875.1 transcriptional regulator [Paenibacillus polymyxa]MCH6190270.1 response regulator [Paenibacillus polymyxa]MDY8095687.1 response regulator [Paenibacillus polymyxa]WRL56855.1 response regulator [Paenibacillus polymyxa]
MRFYIVDDDQGIRSMLADIIEDEGLGEVIGEAEDGSYVNSGLLELNRIDVLLIDLLMPLRDGIQTVRALGDQFTGKIIMISRIESKNMIGEAYSLGIEYYVAKPLNRLEIIAVIHKVAERLRMQQSITDIQRTLQGLSMFTSNNPTATIEPTRNIVTSGQFLLSEMGMIGEAGSMDLLDMLEFLDQYEEETGNLSPYLFPPLKDIFANVASKRLGASASAVELSKEIKASEQRVRRAIFQTLSHIVSLGLTDYTHPKFENYASKFFDFTEIRKKMLELQNNVEPSLSQARINTKKFVQVLYMEAKRLLH